MSNKFFLKKKFGADVLITTFLLSLVVLNSLSAEATSEDEIILDFSFQEPVITEVNISNTTYHRVTMNETQVMSLPGVPLLPVKPLKVLLPQNATLVSINATYEENTSLGNGYNVLIGDFNSSQQNQSNEYNFNTSLPYPPELFSNLGVQYFRGYEVLLLNLFPVHYMNDTGEIYYYKNMSVTITTNDSGSVHPLFRGLSTDETRMEQKLDFSSESSTYVSTPYTCNSSLVPANEEHKMVIITKEEFTKKTNIPMRGRNLLTFKDLANYKNENIEEDFAVIRYVEDILECEDYHWNGTWGDKVDGDFHPDFNDSACHIRNFIKDAYANWGIEYVLLGGDWEIVPHRDLWERFSQDVKNTTSDLYYACLDGNYNNNRGSQDHKDEWGEFDDGDYSPDKGYDPCGGGAYYAIAESGDNFDAALFTPALDLSEHDSVTLNFSKIFKEVSVKNEYINVGVYSGDSASTSVFEEALIEDNYTGDVDDDYGFKVEKTFYPNDEYEDRSKVYIRFCYNNDGGDPDYSNEMLFSIDEVSVRVYDGDYYEEILFESFEGKEFPPEGWDRIKYSSGGNWELQCYKDNLDLVAEVYVGRAPVSTIYEVSNFVTKTIAYNDTKENDNYIKKALWLGVLDIPGGDHTPPRDYKEELREWPCTNHGYQTYGIPDSYTVDTLYDAEWLPTGWPPVILWLKINNGVHLINHLGHGRYQGFGRTLGGKNYFVLSNDQTKWLNNKNYFFMYSQACLSGDFKNYLGIDCLAEYLTAIRRYGAFAVIMNSNDGELSNDEPATTNGISQRFDREFWDAIYGENIYELGRANQDSKEDNLNCLKQEEKMWPPSKSLYRRCFYQLNLFGDPSVKIKLPQGNNNPDSPWTPDSDSQSAQSYKFRTITTDPDGDQISYKWKIDDDECLHWTKYYNSGDNAYQTMYLPPGNHQIRVKARDINLYESNWSNPLNITVPFNSDFHVDSYTVVLGKTVNFYGKASEGKEPYNSWYYDFGDSNSSEQQNTTHVYNIVGNYTVTLNVTDDQNITSNITQVINVVILLADLNTPQGFSISDQMIAFNDTSDGYYDIVNWSWDFDDGTTSYDRNTTHNFTSEGVYNVTLTVTDNQSNTDVHNQFFYVDETSPEINSVSKNFDIVGYGSNITISADVSDNVSAIKNVKINVTYPDSSTSNFIMNNNNGSNYEYTSSDTWMLGDYDFNIWAMDNANNSNISSDYSFTVSRRFGYNKIGSSNQSIWDTITGSVFTAYEKGVADNITVYIDPGNATSDYHYQCVIYRHNDSKLIGVSEEKNISTGKGWQTFNFSVPKPVLINDTEYVLCCWADNYTVSMYYDNGTGSEMYYDNGNSTLQGHYFEGFYNYPPDPNNFDHEDRKYSIYCNYTPDTTPPEITNVSDNPDTVGFGFNVSIGADVADNASGVDVVKVNITYPDDTTGNFSMDNIGNDTYEFVFTDTWLVGQYNYSIWTIDCIGNSDISSGYSFSVSAQATISVCTIEDEYGDNESVNLTDPPGSPPVVGYELLDDDQVLHMWNKHNSYYFNTSSGIQLTNHKDEYWTHNVLMLGYYNNDEWNLMYRTDELSGFTKNVTTDNTSFVNATLWKNLNYGGYDFRLAIRYHLGVDDVDLTVIPYIKNLDEGDIPYVLGFGWEMKDIRIANVTSDNYLRIYNGTGFEDILLNQTLDRSFTDMDYNTSIRFVCMNPSTYHLSRDLYLSWNRNLTYKVTVKSRAGQYNAPVSLFIPIGTLSAGQEKYTMMHWLDSDNWLGVGSSELDAHCGSSVFSLADALDGLDMWSHPVNHEHWFILDLGQQYNIKKFRGRSSTGYDPIDVDIYVSSDNSSWGAAVASNIASWQDTSSWQEVDSTDKEGRYVKVVIQDTEDSLGYRVDWGYLGYPAITIFDVYGYAANFVGCSQDGFIYASSTNYNTAHNASIGSVDSTGDTIKVGQERTFPSNYKIYRGFLFFNTGIIGESDTINSCKLHFYLDSEHVSLRDFDILLQNNDGNVYPHDPLQSGDYDKDYYSGDGGSISTSVMMPGEWYNITFNITSLKWINKEGMTKLCLRSNWDIAGDDPSGIGDEYVVIGSSESSYAPYLEIDCSPVVSEPIPVNGSYGVSIAPVLSIAVSDVNGDNMNIMWYGNSSGNWAAFGSNNSVGDGTYHQTFVNASVNGMWWYWKVNVTDGSTCTESSVYKFYTGYQSKIKNTGSMAINGYLLMQVQFYNMSLEEWVVANDTVNETTIRTINGSEQLGLDTIFNGLVNTGDLLSSFGSGNYRVYACFRDPDGDILVCDDQSLMEASYVFTVSGS